MADGTGEGQHGSSLEGKGQALFRPQVTALSQGQLLGEVSLTLPRNLRIQVAVMVVAGLALLTAMGLTPYASRESVPGWITPSDGLIRIAPASNGRLERMLVVEGQLVAANQPIAAVRIPRETSKGSVGQLIAQATAQEADAATARAAAQVSRIQMMRQQLGQHLESIRKERTQVAARITYQRQQVALAQEALESAQAVAEKGFISAQQLQARRSALLNAEDYLNQIETSLIELDRQAADSSAQARGLSADVDSAQADGRLQSAQIAQRRISQEALDVEVLSAPVAARVLALPRSGGQAVEAGATVAILSARNARLEAELFVPARAAGLIRSGQVVRLKYTAFPFERFGAGTGRVLDVSRTLIPAAEATAAGVKVGEPVFRAHVRLESDHVNAHGQTLPLQPGMLLNADVVTDRHSLFGWMFDPIRRGRE
jgi:membrane fusion protein